MGLMTKIKDILFEEEELTEQIDLKETQPIARKVEKSKEKEEKNIEVVTSKKEVEDKKSMDDDLFTTPFDEQDVFINDSFPFQDFDEEEFSKSLNKEVKAEVEKPINSREIIPTRSTNVLDYERNKKQEKRQDYGRFEKIEHKETYDRKKFKPSPIISPVYGILNEDYRIEDIKHRNEVEDELDFEDVRKRAFETKKKDKAPEYVEDTITVKIEQTKDEKVKKVKTIDDLLEEHSDEVIDVAPKHNKKENIKYDEIEKLEQELDDIEDTKDYNEEENTLENDLFDLIDSMYENREDGDY